MGEVIGGYGSWGFAVVVFAFLFAGSILAYVNNIFCKIAGGMLFLFGGFLLLGCIQDAIKKTSNLPSIVDLFPILFAVILILITFKMMLSGYSKKDKTITKDGK